MRVPRNRSRWALVLGGLGVGAVVTFLGIRGSLSRAGAEPPAGQAQAASEQTPPPAPLNSHSEYSQRAVAYIYGTVPITREELGEYLIARMPPERVNNLVNRRIIEYVCQQKGVEVTAAEVEADFAETLKGLKLTAKEFEEKLLKPHNKSLYEWKEDATRPRLLLTKLCRERVQVTEQDMKNAFDAYFGEKIQCRIIMWPKELKVNVMTQIYPKIRDSEKEFVAAARAQATVQLGAAGGQIDPIGRHTMGNDELEDMIFRLQPGELSSVKETPEGLVVVKCDKRIPAQAGVTMDGPWPTTVQNAHGAGTVRDRLSKEVYDKKLQVEINKYFQELRAKADPQVFV
jgi:hypothetical protein